MLSETKSKCPRNSQDVIAPPGVLRLAADGCGQEFVRGREFVWGQEFVWGNAMIRSRNARALGKLGIAAALTMFLGACGSFNLPSFSSSSPPVAPEPPVVPEVPATIRSDEI